MINLLIDTLSQERIREEGAVIDVQVFARILPWTLGRTLNLRWSRSVILVHLCAWCDPSGALRTQIYTRPIAGAPMRPLAIVLDSLLLDLAARVIQREEDLLVEAPLAEPAV